MKHNEGRTTTTPSELRDLYAPVRAELDQVEQVLRQQLSSTYPFVDQLAKHSFRLGGKRLRPALVLLAAKAGGRSLPVHHDLAAMVEMIHTATLIHDDVLDEAQLRRHLDTVNARWNNETSVLLGDYLLTRALCLVATIDDPFAVRTLGEAARTMCEGELRQVASRGNYDLTEDEYFSIIADKTAALTACCCKLGAHFAGAEAAVCDALTGYGRELGIAFQIADDVLDLVGDEAQVGKSLGTDLLKQKLTLPMIRLFAEAGPADRAAMVAALERTPGDHREALRPWLERSDAVAYARQKAASFVARACATLDAVPPSAARDALAGLAGFAARRQQ